MAARSPRMAEKQKAEADAGGWTASDLVSSRVAYLGALC